MTHLAFQQKVLDLTRQIPKGKITTYKAIALALNSPNASRAVGNALNKNPRPIEIPCHRVINTNGKIGGYIHGEEKKIALLKSEGIEIKNKKVKNLKSHLYDFSTPLSSF